MSEKDDDLGRTVGGYQLVALLGRGGMGAVYLGEHPVLKRRVAIKVILSELAASAEMRDRFLDEARLAASFKDPAFVEVLDLATLDDGRPYIMMEYLDGESVGTMMRRRGAPLPVPEAAAVAVAALDGLAVAHARDVLHRDIKPQNLFVVQDGEHGRVKILDFGLAKLQSAAAGRTRTGALLGTPGYMAPEQASTGKDVDQRADLYAVGVVLYELVAGKPLFHSDDWVDLIHLHRTAEVPAIASASAELNAILVRALAKRPADRFATAREMADTLRPHAGQVPRPELPVITMTAPGPASPAADAAVRVSGTDDTARADGATRALGRKRSASPPADESAPKSAEPTNAAPAPRNAARIGIAVAAVGVAIAATAVIQNARKPHRAAAESPGSGSDLIAAVTPDAAPPIDAAIAQASPPDAGAGSGSGALIVAVADAGVRVAEHGHAEIRVARPDAAAATSTAATTTPPDAAVATAASSTPDAATYWSESDFPTPHAWDFKARISWAAERVHKIYPDARLVSITGGGLAPDGTIDLLNPAGWVEYDFRSPSHTPKKKLGGQMFDCLVGVSIRGGTVQVGTSNSTECNEPWFAAHCSGKDLWRIASAKGATKDQVAGLYLYPSETGYLWRFRTDAYYDIEDAECAP